MKYHSAKTLDAVEVSLKALFAVIGVNPFALCEPVIRLRKGLMAPRRNRRRDKPHLTQVVRN
jgi:hypothetical protein